MVNIGEHGAVATFLTTATEHGTRTFRGGGVELVSKFRGYSLPQQGNMVARVAQLPEGGTYGMGQEARQGYDHPTFTLSGLY